jgi:hypothetical protein
MELNRFKQLLESTMGNVRPLITEQKVSTIPPLSNLPQEIQSDMNTMFNGTVVNDVIQLSGKTPGQIFSIKPTLKIGNLISIYCFMDTSVYPTKLKITDAKEGTKCFVCRSNGNDRNDTSNFVVYTNQSGVDTISQFTQETFNLRNVVTTGNNEQAILYQTYVKFKEYEPFKSDPKTISFNTTENQVNMNFKDPSGKERNIILSSKGAENDGGERIFYLGAFECNETSCPLNEKISVSNKYPLSTVESFKSNGLIP